MKGTACLVLALAVSLSGLSLPGMKRNALSTISVAKAATVTNRLPIVTYTRYNSNLNTYTDSSLRTKTGYICSYDLCTILQVYSNGAVKVRYPVKNNKTRVAYAAMSGFFLDTNFSTATTKLGVRKTAYRKSTGNATIGSVYANDQVTIIGTQNGRTELIYETAFGYKIGWVSGTYSISSNTTWTVGPITATQAKSVMFNAKYYANLYADLKAAFGYNETSLYNHYIKYGIKEGRSASPIFDPIYYLNNNSDLKKAFGSNYTAAYNHWIKYGCSEGRKSSKYYDGLYYRTKYSDLQNAFFSGGASATAHYNLANHYLTYGISERRWANSNGYIPSGMETQNAAPAANESVASKMVSYELSQLGIGDTKGNNNVKYNTWYWGRTINGSGYAWCMAFQAYCCNQVTGSNNAIPRTASCTDAVNKFKQKGQFQYSSYYGGKYTPKAGDLVFYTSNRGKNSCHVGMIISAPVNGYLQTVEGNIQCSDGNWKVVKFTKNAKRTVSNSYVWGYATPSY